MAFSIGEYAVAVVRRHFVEHTHEWVSSIEAGREVGIVAALSMAFPITVIGRMLGCGRSSVNGGAFHGAIGLGGTLFGRIQR